MTDSAYTQKLETLVREALKNAEKNGFIVEEDIGQEVVSLLDHDADIADHTAASDDAQADVRAVLVRVLGA